ncbi:hypothetical protein ACFORL_08650 [Legionella dresdenensis]|uniref:Uncharacterized protein n=1 Tax=Legionella dresdenensis TaxID=450200 RepID=A0ABV8CFP5_9GAMM
MAAPHLKLIKYFNVYSIYLINIYTAFVLINNHFNVIRLEDISLTLPLIIGICVWSYNTLPLIRKAHTNKIEAFRRDLFLIFYSIIAAEMFSFLIHYSNVDIRSWWVFTLYYFSLIGIIYSLIYSIIAIALEQHHKKYTFFIFYLIIFVITAINLLAYRNYFSIYARDEFYYSCLVGVLCIHIVVCVITKIRLIFIKNK